MPKILPLLNARGSCRPPVGPGDREYIPRNRFKTRRYRKIENWEEIALLLIFRANVGITYTFKEII